METGMDEQDAVAAPKGYTEEKYTKMKHKLRDTMEENERLCYQLAWVLGKIDRLRKRKMALLDRLGTLEASDGTVNTEESEDMEVKEGQPEVLSFGNGGTPLGQKRRFSYEMQERKRRRQQKVADKVRRVQPVPKNELGEYVMPVRTGIVTVLCLGKVTSDRDAYHNERYIWPVGYTAQRQYNSMVNPYTATTYTCTVLDGGDTPKFQVVAADNLDNVITANTATGTWTTIVKTANAIRKKAHSNSASGPDYYGFTHPTIAKMIQELPGADQCKQYVFQAFEEMNPRHARTARAKNIASLVSGKPKPPTDVEDDNDLNYSELDV